MKDSHYRISLDIHSTQSQVSLPVKQGDTSRKVFISLCEGGKPYHIEDDSFAVFSAKKPDKNIIENNCVIADNVIEYSITEQTSSVRGILNCEIKLYSVNYGLITSPSFTIIVDGRAVSDEEIESTSEYTSLTDLYTDTFAIKNEIETKLANGEFDGEDVDYNLVANALKGSASGNSIRLEDVSPAEHTFKVKTTSNSTDLTTAKLVVYSGNLIPKAASSTSAGITATVSIDGTISFSGTTTSGYNYILCQETFPSGTYTMRWNKVGLDNVRCSVYDATSSTMLGYNDCTFTTDGTKSIRIYCNVGTTGVSISGSIKPMLNFGSTAMPYEPHYKALTAYPINSDGTVDGVTSIYPTTILTTDTEGVTIDVEYNKDANKVIAELLTLIQKSSRIAYIDLIASKWQGSASPYYQVVSVPGATKNSQVDLTPSAEQLSVFHNKDLAFVTENNNGVITVYAIGQKPMNDYTIQATLTEVNV